MNLDDVHRGIWRRKRRKRLGRGPESGHGKTCGRGHKGQGSRAGFSMHPAFEGGHIKYGMRAASGAIEKMRLVDGTVQYQTIDGAPPVGICGSGILDTIAQLYLAGIIDAGGRMQPDHPLITTRRKQRQFTLVSRSEPPPITVTQADIRELQLAKAAIRSGIQVLLDTSGCREDQIERVIIAGAFGSYIDLESAVTLGLLPPLPINCFWQVGNAAGVGAKLALLSLSKRAEASSLPRR